MFKPFRRLFGFFGKGKKGYGRPPAGFKGKVGRRGIVAYSPEFKAFVNENRSVLLPTYRLIQDNFGRLKQGHSVVDKQKGIQIQRAVESSSERRLHLKVGVLGKEFFVKVGLEGKCDDLLRGIEVAERFFEERGNKIEGFKVKVVRPHLFYDSNRPGVNYTVTDFFKQGEVILVRDLLGGKGQEIFDAITRIRPKLEAQHVHDLRWQNLFYNTKTDTVLITDLYYKEKY